MVLIHLLLFIPGLIGFRHLIIGLGSLLVIIDSFSSLGSLNIIIALDFLTILAI